jgi:hypothetical protein
MTPPQSPPIYYTSEEIKIYSKKNKKYPIDRDIGKVYNLHLKSGEPFGREYNIMRFIKGDIIMHAYNIKLNCYNFYKKVAFDMKRAEKRIRRRRKHNIKKILDIIFFNDISYDIIQYI